MTYIHQRESSGHSSQQYVVMHPVLTLRHFFALNCFCKSRLSNDSVRGVALSECHGSGAKPSPLPLISQTRPSQGILRSKVTHPNEYHRCEGQQSSAIH